MLTECEIYGKSSGDPVLTEASALQEASASYRILGIASAPASAPAPVVKEAEASCRNLVPLDH